ncbi:MAG: Rne/Rng family ribonuclease [Actinobacteria bacterium]|nr:Rne/Rng family ribonuclease [Actinomycetota bacterium]
MSEVVPGAPVSEYSGNSADSTPARDAPTVDTSTDNAPAQRPALSPESTAAIAAAKKRRRGRRGGRNRNRNRTSASGTRTQSVNTNTVHNDSDENDTDDLRGDDESETLSTARVQQPPRAQIEPRELPDPPQEGRMMSAEVAGEALVRKPQIGDTRPAPPSAQSTSPAVQAAKQSKRGAQQSDNADKSSESGERNKSRRGGKRGGRNRRGRSNRTDDRETTPGTDAELMERRKGKERNGKAVGRYLMCVQVRPDFTQVAMLEGRSLIEHYVSRPADDDSQIHGNIYLGRVQNVLPGMEAAFVDIGTPKNAVLYRGDVQFDKEDVVEQGADPRIEQVLKARQLILCQVTKNPIAAKGGRLTQEVSLPGRFVVLIPDSRTYGISKRLPEGERRRLRGILDRIKPEQHGIIVRTAAENATEHELTTDMTRLLAQRDAIRSAAEKANSPTLLYREPPLAVRVIREEFTSEYRGVVIDDPVLFAEVRDYIQAFNPEFADRVELYNPAADELPLFEQYRVHEQLLKALDKKVWLPSGGSLIIEHTEALTVIDVNTGKNVGKSNLEETVFYNNLEAAEEIARQLRLRDIGGIIVIDFIDMEIRENRRKVLESFKDALARDKTRTQVFEISELGLVEMTRKRIGEGLLTSFADACAVCDSRGFTLDLSMLD